MDRDESGVEKICPAETSDRFLSECRASLNLLLCAAVPAQNQRVLRSNAYPASHVVLVSSSVFDSEQSPPAGSAHIDRVPS